MRRRLLSLALAVAALGGAGAAPAAHAGWGPALTVTRPVAENIAATGNASGEQLLAWRVTTKRRVRIGARTGFESYIRARVRLAGGTLGAVRAISSTREVVAAPAVALDAAGNATVVWSQAGAGTRIMGAHRPRGGRFGTPFELGRTTAFLDARPAIAVTPAGAATVAWNGGAHVQVVRRATTRCRARRTTGCFGRPQSFPRGADQTVAMTPGATAFLAYAATARIGDEVRSQIRLAIAPRDGLFGPTRAIPGAGRASQPSLALWADASAVMAWRAAPPTGGEQDVDGPILVAVRDAIGRLVGPVVVSRFPGSHPQLRANAQGEAILAWNQRNPSPLNPDGPEVAVAVRPASGGAFGRALTISPAGAAAGNASLAIDAAGDATLVYSAAVLGADLTPGPVTALAHHRATGAAFGAAEPLPAEFPGAFVFAAGARVTAVSAGFAGGRTALSDYVR